MLEQFLHRLSKLHTGSLSVCLMYKMWQTHTCAASPTYKGTGKLICLTPSETRCWGNVRSKVTLGEAAWPSHSVDTAPAAAAAVAVAQELELALPLSVRSTSSAALGWRRYGQTLHRATRTVHGGPPA